MRVLIHVCCGPCFTAVSEHLVRGGDEPTALYYNPNIHPPLEYRRRLIHLRRFCRAERLPLLVEKYEPTAFFRAVHGDEERPARCRRCYELRLGAAAARAAAEGYDAFSTTLLISPYQFHETLVEVGESLERTHGVHFFCRDWRPYFRRSVELSRAFGLYRQRHCGCVYGEHEQFASKIGQAESGEET